MSLTEIICWKYRSVYAWLTGMKNPFILAVNDTILVPSHPLNRQMNRVQGHFKKLSYITFVSSAQFDKVQWRLLFFFPQSSFSHMQKIIQCWLGVRQTDMEARHTDRHTHSVTTKQPRNGFESMRSIWMNATCHPLTDHPFNLFKYILFYRMIWMLRRWCTRRHKKLPYIIWGFRVMLYFAVAPFFLV